MNRGQSKEFPYAYQNLRIYGSNDLWMYVHATFPELANYIQRVKTLIPVYFFCRLPAGKR